MHSTVAQIILQDRKIAYAITDKSLNIIELGGAANILGYGQQRRLGHSLYELFPEFVGSEDVLADLLVGVTTRYELTLVNRETAAGQTAYANVSFFPQKTETGQIIGVIVAVQDVTSLGTPGQRLVQQRNELRLLRDELERQNLRLAAANAELQRLDELKSVFVSIAAHELRTPLTAVGGYVELLLDEGADPLTQRQAEYLEIIQRSAQRLLTMASDMLDLTRIEAGRMELALQPTDLAELVETTAVEHAPQLEARAQLLTLRAPPDLPLALCDRDRTTQILGNLLSNASKYTPHGGSLTIALAPATEDGFLEVTVADNGVGIPKEEQERLFSRFYRASSARTTGAHGAGLGLYITRSLVELHGGRIWFVSEPNRGTTFHVTFPNADGDRAPGNGTPSAS